MPQIDLSFRAEGDAAWRDLENKEVVEATGLRIAGLPGGMQSGRTSVGILLEMPDGTFALAQTSLRLFLAAASGLRARYGEN